MKIESVCFMPDGTNIEYTVSGNGEKLLFIHGSSKTSSEKSDLAEVIAARFTVYQYDRRGWGNSGPKGKDYSLAKECEDAARFIADHEIDCVFGDDYGAVIALNLALFVPLKKIILFEPFLAFLRNLNWLPKMERYLEKKDYFNAIAAYTKGTNHKTRFVPSFLVKKLYAAFSIDPNKKMMTKIIEYDDPKQQTRYIKDIESDEWISNKRMLDNIPVELITARQLEQGLDGLRSLTADVLIVCKRESEPFVFAAVDKLEALIPNNRKITVASAADFINNGRDL
ncbi:MAG: alpha/beta hydrolase [Defluviitaleaceae bacterium]|nr:alpha/beta hydrolase [Defluviitaleaceae bacterium]